VVLASGELAVERWVLEHELDRGPDVARLTRDIEVGTVADPAVGGRSVQRMLIVVACRRRSGRGSQRYRPA
jgi:hypothetical protein